MGDVMRRWQLALLILSGVFCANSNQAAAQPEAPGEPAPAAEKKEGDRDPALDAKREALRKRIRKLRAKRVARALGEEIDEATRTRIAEVLRASDEKIAAARAALAAEWRALGVAVRARADDATLNRHLDAVAKLKQKYNDLVEQRTAELRKVLSPAQAALVLASMERVDRALGGGIRRAVERRRRHRGLKQPFGDASAGTDGPDKVVDPFAPPGRREARQRRRGWDRGAPDLANPFDSPAGKKEKGAAKGRAKDKKNKAKGKGNGGGDDDLRDPFR